MADCESGCTGSCTGGCTSCSGCTGCRGCTSCSGCTGCTSCYGCTGCSSCSGSCDGTCCDTCTNDCVEACMNSCRTECLGNCYTGCETSCYTSCENQCKGYCSQYCQTYCQKQQTFSLNVSPIKNAIGKGTFSWTNPVCQNQTIKITHEDWNKLKSYIQTATQYCGGTAPDEADVNTDDLITEVRYNDLADGLDLNHVTKDVTIISKDNIDILRTTYNNRQIDSSLPYNPSESSNSCCQSGETCMASGQLLSHQKKTEKCQNQIVSTCGGQSPGR